MRIRTSFILITAVCVNFCLLAGDKVSFSGIWILDETGSTLDENGAQFLPTQLTVTQSDSDITVQKLFQSDFADDMIIEENITLDGKACKSEFMGSPRVSTANWSDKGDTLNIAMTISLEGGSSEMKLNEAWTLNDRQLSIKHHSSSSWGARNVTMIFNKKEENVPANKTHE